MTQVGTQLSFSSDGIFSVILDKLNCHLFFVFNVYAVDAISCKTSHILSALSSSLPSLSLCLINNTVLAILAFLQFLWSWHALAWSRLPSGSLGMAARAAAAPCSPTIVFAGATLYPLSYPRATHTQAALVSVRRIYALKNKGFLSDTRWHL